LKGQSETKLLVKSTWSEKVTVLSTFLISGKKVSNVLKREITLF